MAFNYWCENRIANKECQLCNRKGDVTLDEESQYHCPNDEKTRLKLIGQTTHQGINTGQFKKGRDPKEAKKRSSEHFQKEILPTLSKRDQRYFIRKKGYKLP